MLFKSPASRRTLGLAALALAAAGWLPATAGAQQFPTKPVRIITPFPVGGGPDGVARLVADKLSRTWGQPGEGSPIPLAGRGHGLVTGSNRGGSGGSAGNGDPEHAGIVMDWVIGNL